MLRRPTWTTGRPCFRLLAAAALLVVPNAREVEGSTGECVDGYNLGAIYFSGHSIADSELTSFATDVKGAIAKVLKGRVSIRANCVPAANYGQSVHVRLWTTAPPDSDTFVYDMAAGYIKKAVDDGDLDVPGVTASQTHWDADGFTETSTQTTTATTLPTTTKTPCQGFNVGALVFDDYNRDSYLSGEQEATFSKRVLDKAKMYLLTADPKVTTGIKCSFVTYGAFDSKDGKGMRVHLVVDAADEVSNAEQEELSGVRRVLIDKIDKGSFFVLKVDEDEPTRASSYDGGVVDYVTTTATSTQTSTQSTTATTTGTSAYSPKFSAVPAGSNVVYLGIPEGVNCRPQTNGLNYLLGTCEKPHGALDCNTMEGAAADGGDLQLIADNGGSASCQQTADAISDLVRELTGPLNSLDLKMKCTSFKYLYMEASDADSEAAVAALADAVDAYFSGEIHGCEITTVTSTGTSTVSSTATSTATTISTSATSTVTSTATTSPTTSATTTVSSSATTSATTSVTSTGTSSGTSSASSTGSSTPTSTATTTVTGTPQTSATTTATSSESSTATTTPTTSVSTTGSSTVTTSTITTSTITTSTITTSTLTSSTTSVTTTTTSTITVTTTTTATVTTVTTLTTTTKTTTTTPTTTPMFGYCNGEEDPDTCFIEFKETACEGALKEHVRVLCPAMCHSCMTTTATSTLTSTETSTVTTSTTSTTTVSTTTSTSTTTTTSATSSTTTTTSVTSTRSTTTTITATTDTTTTTMTATTTTTSTTRTVDPCLDTVGLGVIVFTVYNKDSLGDSDENTFARSVLVEANWQLSKAGYTTRITCTEVSYGSLNVRLGANPSSGTASNHVQAALMLEGMVASGSFEVPMVGSRTETVKPEMWSRVYSDIVDDSYTLLPIATTTLSSEAGKAFGDEDTPLPTGWIVVGAMLVAVAILGFFIAGLVYKRKQEKHGTVKPHANGAAAVYGRGTLSQPVTAQSHEHPDYQKGAMTSGGQQRSRTPFPRPLSFVNANNSRPGTQMSNRTLPQIPTVNQAAMALPPGVSMFGAPSPPMSPMSSIPQSPMGVDAGMDFFQDSAHTENAALNASHLSISGMSNYAIATESGALASPLPPRLPRHAEESNLDQSMTHMQTMLGQLMRDEDVDSSYMDMDGELESADQGQHFYPVGPGSMLPMTML